MLSHLFLHILQLTLAIYSMINENLHATTEVNDKVKYRLLVDDDFGVFDRQTIPCRRKSDIAGRDGSCVKSKVSSSQRVKLTEQTERTLLHRESCL